MKRPHPAPPPALVVSWNRDRLGRLRARWVRPAAPKPLALAG